VRHANACVVTARQRPEDPDDEAVKVLARQPMMWVAGTAFARTAAFNQRELRHGPPLRMMVLASRIPQSTAGRLMPCGKPPSPGRVGWSREGAAPRGPSDPGRRWLFEHAPPGPQASALACFGEFRDQYARARGAGRLCRRSAT
jgi:hypothetical protein